MTQCAAFVLQREMLCVWRRETAVANCTMETATQGAVIDSCLEFDGGKCDAGYFAKHIVYVAPEQHTHICGGLFSGKYQAANFWRQFVKTCRWKM